MNEVQAEIVGLRPESSLDLCFRNMFVHKIVGNVEVTGTDVTAKKPDGWDHNMIWLTGASKQPLGKDRWTLDADIPAPNGEAGYIGVRVAEGNLQHVRDLCSGVVYDAEGGLWRPNHDSDDAVRGLGRACHLCLK